MPRELARRFGLIIEQFNTLLDYCPYDSQETPITVEVDAEIYYAILADFIDETHSQEKDIKIVEDTTIFDGFLILKKR